MTQQMLTDEQFINVINNTPLVSIDLIIQAEDKQVLLGKRNNRPAKGWWFVPGGRILKNETIKQAFERICLQELGLELKYDQAQLQGCYDHIYLDNYLNAEEVNTHYVVLAHKVQLKAQAGLRSDEQHSKFAWWELEQVLKNPNVHENTKAYFR